MTVKFIRFFIYGWLALTGELFFLHMTRLGKLGPQWVSWLFAYDWQIDSSLQFLQRAHTVEGALIGYVSIWMFGVYGCIGIFGMEPAIGFARFRFPWWIRGILYSVVIGVMECVLGWVLFWITGYRIWYYADNFHILQFTSAAILPAWFLVGLLVERLIIVVGAAQQASIVTGTNSNARPAVVTPKPKRSKGTVVVIHGLWLSNWWMHRLAAGARRAGYNTICFQWGTWTEKSSDVLNRLCDVIKGINDGDVHILAHSLGGNYALRALERLPHCNIKRVLLVGSPLQGSRLARIAQNIGLGFLALGHHVQLCTTPAPTKIATNVSIGMIVGTLPFGLGLPIHNVRFVHDGMISIAETQSPIVADTTRVLTSHIGLMFSRHVRQQSVEYLQSGEFSDFTHRDALFVN